VLTALARDARIKETLRHFAGAEKSLTSPLRDYLCEWLISQHSAASGKTIRNHAGGRFQIANSFLHFPRLAWRIAL